MFELSTTKQIELDFAAAIIRLSNTMRGRLDATLAPHGIGWAAYEALVAICDSGSITYRQLAKSLSRHRTSIRSTVTVLIGADLIERFQGNIRRDEYHLEATPLGREVYMTCRKTMNDSSSTLLSFTEHVELMAQLTRLGARHGLSEGF